MNDYAGQRIKSVPTSGSRVYSLNEAEIAVLEALRAMNYGSLEITVHNSKIVQVERTERMRFTETAGK